MRNAPEMEFLLHAFRCRGGKLILDWLRLDPMTAHFLGQRLD
eukprot:SAG31_NODE_1543_length_7944_cov_8.711281_4_plen_42_part_00